MGCFQSKQSPDKEIEQALSRIKEKEHAIDELIRQHEQMIQQGQKQMQLTQQKGGIDEQYKSKINSRFDQLEKNLEKFNTDGFRLNNNSNNNNNNKEGQSKSPSTIMQAQMPNNNNNNNNNGNILYTEDIILNSKQAIQSPPISISPNQLPNQMQLQRESSQQSQGVSSSQHIQNQQSQQILQQQQQAGIAQQQQQQQQQISQSQQYQLQQQQQNQIIQQQAQPQQMLFAQPKTKHPSRKSSAHTEHRLSSPKKISMGSNGKIMKQQKSNNNPAQAEDDMQHWNNIIQALDDISIRPIDQFNENQQASQQKNLFPSTDVLDFDLTGRQKNNNNNNNHNNMNSQQNSQTLPAQQGKTVSAHNSRDITAASNPRPKTSNAALALDQIIQNNPEISKIHQKVSNVILKNA